MNFKKWAAVLAVLVLAGCAQAPKKQAFNKEGAGYIKSLAIAQPQRDEAYEAIVLGHPGMSFGLIGGLIAAADMQAKSEKLTKALNPADTRLQETFSKRLSENLANTGYQTKIVPVPKGTDDAKVVDLLKKNGGDADALLAVSVTGRYMAAGPSSDYFPSIVVKVWNIDAKSGHTLYEDTFTYGYNLPQMQTVHFASDDSYRFPDIDKLVAEPARTRAGLIAGLDAIIAQITSDLKKN